MRNDEIPPTGLEGPWAESRINLLRGLYTTASYLADVAHDHKDLHTAELCTDIMTRTIHLEAYAQRKAKETE